MCSRFFSFLSDTWPSLNGYLNLLGTVCCFLWEFEFSVRPDCFPLWFQVLRDSTRLFHCQNTYLKRTHECLVTFSSLLYDVAFLMICELCDQFASQILTTFQLFFSSVLFLPAGQPVLIPAWDSHKKVSIARWMICRYTEKNLTDQSSRSKGVFFIILIDVSKVCNWE